MSSKIKYMVAALALCCSFITISCKQKQDRVMLYNIDSLVLAQSRYLTVNEARLEKIAFLGGESDTSYYTPEDTLAWNKELDIFRQLDIINKPVNRTHYLVDDGLMDPASNLTVKAFSDTTDLAVVYLRVFYQESLQKPRKIEALYNEKNALYKSARLVSMEFHQLNNTTVMISYSISGGQKMVLEDSVAFMIKGKVFID